MNKIKSLILGIIFLIHGTFSQNDAIPRIKCSRTSVCGVGLCCRSNDGKIIPSALYYFTEVDWWRAQIGLNPGNCSTELAKEGEFCDSFCLCSPGLLCTPNILCRNCGNICMASDFVNKLVTYYDLGCNCIGNTAGISGLSALKPPLTSGLPNNLGQGLNPIHTGLNQLTNGINPIYGLNNINGYPLFNGAPFKGSLKSNQTNSTVKIVDNIVQLPGLK